MTHDFARALIIRSFGVADGRIWTVRAATMGLPTVEPSTWERPDAMLAKLPTSMWSVLDMWTLPDDVAALSPEEHGTLVAGLARTPASDASAFAPGALSRVAPLGAAERALAMGALWAFFVTPFALLLAPPCVVASWAGLAPRAVPRAPSAVAAATVLLFGAALTWAPRLSPGVKHNRVVRAVFKYFSFRLAFAPGARYTADRAYIHVCAPHSVFPFGGLLWQLSPCVWL